MTEQRLPICSCGHTITAHDLHPKTGARTCCSHHYCQTQIRCLSFTHAEDWVWEHTFRTEQVHTDDHGSS